MRWVATKFDGLDSLEFQSFELPEPAADEITIRVAAAGVNPIDLKILGRLSDPSLLPRPVGYELSGVVEAIGSDARPATPGLKVGDEVVAFRTPGGYATRINVPAKDVFAKPPTLSFDEAAGLLLVATTAAEMLDKVGVKEGDTVLLHGASGAIGAIVLQLAARLGATVIGTTSARNAENVSRFGGIPVEYGEGLADRVRAAAPDGVTVALDAAGTDEAIQTSLELVSDRNRILTIVVQAEAEKHGFHHVGGSNPDSAAFRDAHRAELIELAGSGELQVPISHTIPLEEAKFALDLVAHGSASGKVVLHP
ncbi:NADP-dependent oxidoreductase [Gulosibacter molinativorax]|uniref:NADP-dependent oxidoreductase n=2 Tax=Gulosibacter molinativorax TaxID=256821 RepID=A0ABT7CC73_9MICO|nr:NADP-dependent oxidoreductase [Gulosibacter molinativorax]